jgi:hypothetical protein
MRPKEVSDRLQLDKIAKDHVWKVEPSCATTGEGIFEGLVRSPPVFPTFLVPLLTSTGMAFQQRQAATGRQINVSPRLLLSPTRIPHLYDCMHSTTRALASAYTRFSLVIMSLLLLCNFLIPAAS